MIGRVVERVDDLPDRLSLRFTSDAILDIPKTSEDADAEVAHFVPTVEGKLHVASMVIWESRQITRLREWYTGELEPLHRSSTDGGR
jgi:hypothetical protein